MMNWTPDFFKNDELTPDLRCRFIFSGKNDELTPDFFKNDELTPDFFTDTG